MCELVWGEPGTFVKKRRVRRKHPLYTARLKANVGSRVLSGGGATAWSTCNTSVDPPPPRFTPRSTRTRHENNHGRVCYVIAMPRFIVILQSDSRDSAGRKLRFREVASSPLSCCRPLQSGGSIKRCCEATGAATRAAHMRSPESYHDSTPSCSGARTRVSA